MNMLLVSWMMVLGGFLLLFISIFNREKGFANSIIFGVLPMIMGFVLLGIGLRYILS